MPLLKNSLLVIPELFEDELLASAIIRLSDYTGIPLYKIEESHLGYIYRNKSRLNHNFLGVFEDPGKLFSHTVYKYYLSCFLGEEQEVIKNRLLSGDDLATRLKMCETWKPGKRKKELHFCPECAREDYKKVGYPYFHVHHQVGGIDVCPVHGVKLYKKDESPYRITREDLGLSIEKGTDEEFKLAKNLLLFEGLNREKIYSAILSELRIREIANRGNKISHKGLINLLLDYYPRDYLKSLGITENSSTVWISILSQNKNMTPPLTYLLLITALNIDLRELSDKEFSEKKELLPEHHCVNPYCFHGSIKPYYKDNRTLFYKCPQCGVRFTQSGKILETGIKLLQCLKVKYDSGETNLKTLAKESGISVNRLKKLFSGEEDPLLYIHKIEKAREECHKYRNRREFSHKDSSSYRTLMVHDRDWLDTNLPLHNNDKFKRLDSYEEDLRCLNFLKSIEHITEKEPNQTKRYYTYKLGFKRYETIKNVRPMTSAYIEDRVKRLGKRTRLVS